MHLAGLRRNRSCSGRGAEGETGRRRSALDERLLSQRRLKDGLAVPYSPLFNPRGLARAALEMSTEPQTDAAHLKRVLGRWDLVLLFVVAIVNLNVVPSISASGGMTVWLWLISLVFFFWPQGIAVVELSHRYPGEGGIYLWTKKIFGDFHGFLSGWCYWTNNIFYVPTVVLIFLGIAVFAAGPRAVGLANNQLFTLAVRAGPAGLARRAEYSRPRRRQVGKQHRRHRHRRRLAHPDRPRHHHDPSLRREPHAARHAHPVRPELALGVRRRVFRAGRPGTGLDHGRRNPRAPARPCPSPSPGAA